MNRIAELIDRFLSGDDPARVLREVEAEGAGKAAVFGFVLAHRLHATKNGVEVHLDKDFTILCSRAGVDDDFRVLDGVHNTL